MKNDLSEKLPFGLQLCSSCVVPHQHSEQWEPELQRAGKMGKQMLAPTVSLL